MRTLNSFIKKHTGNTDHRRRSMAGKKAEGIFLEYCKYNDIPTKVSSRQQDMKYHIDGYMRNGESYDVKSAKAGYKDKGLLLVEISNVAGNKGWCNPDPEAPKWINFYLDDKECFLCVKNSDLYDYVVKNTKIRTKITDDKSEAQKNGFGYTRKGREDLMIWIKKEQITDNCEHFFIYKNSEKCKPKEYCPIELL
tara:strand:- start:53 stop:637 length:585 start_codon:yes stop_codon:yes gene_type:complete